MNNFGRFTGVRQKVINWPWKANSYTNWYLRSEINSKIDEEGQWGFEDGDLLDWVLGCLDPSVQLRWRWIWATTMQNMERMGKGGKFHVRSINTSTQGWVLENTRAVISKTHSSCFRWSALQLGISCSCSLEIHSQGVKLILAYREKVMGF